MEFKVVFVLGLVDPLEALDDVLMDVSGEWLGGLDLIVGGGVESEDPGSSGDDLGSEKGLRWR